MPLVFFISPADERLISTIKQILKPPEKGGLTSNGLVFRCTLYIYLVSDIDNHLLAEDGVGGREGSFSMCTFWLVEALTRAGKYDKTFIAQAVLMFEDMITYSNHLGLYSEEITRSGEVWSLLEESVDHDSRLGISLRRLLIWLVSVRHSISIAFCHRRKLEFLVGHSIWENLIKMTIFKCCDPNIWDRRDWFFVSSRLQQSDIRLSSCIWSKGTYHKLTSPPIFTTQLQLIMEIVTSISSNPQNPPFDLWTLKTVAHDFHSSEFVQKIILLSLKLSKSSRHFWHFCLWSLFTIAISKSEEWNWKACVFSCIYPAVDVLWSILAKWAASNTNHYKL